MEEARDLDSQKWQWNSKQELWRTDYCVMSEGQGIEKSDDYRSHEKEKR